MKIVLIILTLTAWTNLALGQDAAPDSDATDAQQPLAVDVGPAPEKFVAPDVNDTPMQSGTLELRPDATVSDDTILLRNICRWDADDDAVFQPIADLKVGRFSGNSLYATIRLNQIRDTLRDAGVNLAVVNFGGATMCAVNRPTAQIRQRIALDNWIDSASQSAPIASASTSAQAEPAAAVQQPIVSAATASPEVPAALVPSSGTVRSLRDLLTADLCGRLQIDPNNVEIAFNPQDEKVLKLSEPVFQFNITAENVHSLGNVSWDVTISAGGQKQQASIEATARMWRSQLVLQRPLAYHQPIRDEDVAEKRALTDQLTTDDPLLTHDQTVGQVASRDLKPGAVLTASMVDPVLLAQQGQLITVNVVRGSIKITAVARALENGSYGQTIRARNDVDPTQTYEVLLTGPQEGTVTAIPSDTSSAAAD
jgi:flagella basal body P-ring formation protein FlgA